MGAKVYTVLESGYRGARGGGRCRDRQGGAARDCGQDLRRGRAAGRAVVGLVGWEGASGDCDNVSALDLDAGTVLWSAPLTESSGAWEMALSGFGDQAVAGAGGYVYAFDLRSGTVKWKYKSQDDGGVYGSWDIRDVLASSTQIAVTVQKMDQKTKYIGGVVVLDPATGSARAKTQLANGPDSWPSLLAADLVVVFDEWNATGILGKKAGVIAVYDGALKLPVPGSRSAKRTRSSSTRAACSTASTSTTARWWSVTASSTPGWGRPRTCAASARSTWRPASACGRRPPRSRATPRRCRRTTPACWCSSARTTAAPKRRCSGSRRRTAR
ncbi:outer membrane protein assembly factor BamB family protein [Yinghuangia aomiensis]